MRIRQIALVARDLDAVVSELCSVLGIEVAFNDPGVEVFGLRNAVMPIGDTFLEVVSPAREGTTAGRLMDRRGGDGGYMVIMEVDDLAPNRERAEGFGVRVVWEIDVEGARAVHLHPRDIGGAILSFDQMLPPVNWLWAGPDWESKVRTGVVSGIVGVTLQGEDPAGMAGRWAEVLGSETVEAGDGEYRIPVHSGVVRFARDADGRGDGVACVDLRVNDRQRLLDGARSHSCEVAGDAVKLCGTWFRIMDSEAGVGLG